MFKNKRFDIENALAMHARSFVYLPATALYEEDTIGKYDGIIKRCHIYLIGFVPIVEINRVEQIQEKIIVWFRVLGREYDISLPIPSGLVLRNDNDNWFGEDTYGNRFAPSLERLLVTLNQKHKCYNFDVNYIGQAYGREGTRNAVDRLFEHKALQKISLLGAPQGHRIELLLLEIEPNNSVATLFNPEAKEGDTEGERLSLGIEKLFGTDQAERITLYEASMIRHFRPKYNIEFKDSFPSTNMKVLRDCYDKDFSAVVAEVCFEDLPFQIFSSSVKPSQFHIVTHQLHKAQDRHVFFS